MSATARRMSRRRRVRVDIADPERRRLTPAKPGVGEQPHQPGVRNATATHGLGQPGYLGVREVTTLDVLVSRGSLTPLDTR